MSTNTIIGIVVAVLVVGGGAWYMSSNSTSTESTGTGGEQAEEQGSGTGTFAALIGMGGSRTCDITVANADMTASGTVYISGENVRGDFTTTASGQTMTGHMLQTGGYVYSWSDAAPQGMKMRVEGTQSTSAQGQAIDPNAEVTYDCSMGVSDSGVFTVPATVTFMELGAGGSLPAGMMPR